LGRKIYLKNFFACEKISKSKKQKISLQKSKKEKRRARVGIEPWPWAEKCEGTKKIPM
jgi:hypothetical protein